MKVFKYQFWHLLSLWVFLICIFLYVSNHLSILEGSLWGIKTSTWFLLALLAPIIHQFYVVICWRIELYYKSLSKTFGSKGFKLYKIGFALLILARPITIILLALSSVHSLQLNTAIAYTIAIILSIPSIYLFYSVKKYFGIDRAFGIDHFDTETAKKTPFVKKGIFKYTSNGMYLFGFLILWIPGLLLFSKAAILIALFNHLYIWAHYYFTELPDIKFIYRNN